MAIVIKPITVEVSKPNVFQAIAAKQNDSNSRFLKATFVNEGEQINVIPSAKVTINAERNDGESNSFFGEVNNDGTVTVPVHSWILELPGIVNCDISIIEGDSKLTSTTFTLLVEEASHTSEDISTDEQYDVLGELINEVKEMQSGGVFGNAIADTVSGTAIAITDISPLEHILGVTAKSKNILNENEPDTAQISSNGEGWKQENGSWIGFNAYYKVLSFGSYRLTKGQTVTISFDCETVGSNGRMLFGTAMGKGDILSKIVKVGKNAFTYTATDNIDIYVTFTDYRATGDYIIKNIMLCYGTDNEYIPHIADISTAKVQRYGKNLFDYDYTFMQAGIHRIDSKNMLIPIQNQVFAFSIDKTPSEFGLLIEYEDGSTQNKTLTYSATKYFFKFDGEVLKFGSTSNCGANSTLNGKVKRFGFWAYGQDGAGWDTEPLCQVELNTEPTEYEPYTNTPYPINTDGTVKGVTSIAPTTSLMSDTEGIVLDVNYNVDTKKYIDNKFAELAALIVNS